MYLEDQLLNYAGSGDYGFHMPGHKRQSAPNAFLGGVFPLASVDVTEIPGFDDLHDPQGILKEEMERAAAFYGTKATLFSVNGSTASNLAAISAAVPFGGRLLMAENCHRSVYHAVELRQIRADALKLDEIAPDVPGPVTAEQVEKAFREAETAAGNGRDTAAGISCRAAYDAVIITSPTYEGVVSDVEAIAEIAHEHGAVLIVDEAHGAHFPMHETFPPSAIRWADLVTQSLHKTLPSLTQTSVLHNVTGRIGTEELMRWLDIFETSSPSYILMASITSCLHLLMERGPELFEPYVKLLNESRAALKEMKSLRLLETGRYDPSKIVILTNGLITGEEVANRLRTNYHLILEKTMPHYALAMTSVADTAEGLERLTKALLEIDGELAGRA